jgi:hypothetical protein
MYGLAVKDVVYVGNSQKLKMDFLDNIQIS